MIKITQPVMATLALMTVLAAASPVHAQDAMAPTASAPEETAPVSPEPKKEWHHGEHDIEAHIKHLHDKLKITAEQETQWQAVADTMRDNEKAIHALIAERHAQVKTLSAVDDLESYEKIADQHTEGLKKLIPAFKDLYATMSDAQKKNADTVFGRYEGHPDRKAMSAKSAK